MEQAIRQIKSELAETLKKHRANIKPLQHQRCIHTQSEATAFTGLLGGTLPTPGTFEQPVWF